LHYLQFSLQEDVEFLKELGAILEIKTETVIELQEEKEYKIKELIELVKSGDMQIEEFAIYAPYDAGDEYDENLTVYVDKYPYCTDEEDDSYPESIREKGLWYFYSGQQFADVIRAAISDKKVEPTITEFVNALNYYSKNDTFMPFG